MSDAFITEAPASLVNIMGALELSKGYFAERRTISQEMAKKLVEARNTKFQRDLKSRTKGFIREQLRAGQWVNDSVVSLGFVKGQSDFYILNGQHRLSVLSELKDKEMTVLLHILAFESEDQVMVYATTAVDANAQRSPADQLSIAGITENLLEKQKPLARALGPALHLLWSRMKGTGGGPDRPMPMPMKIRAFEDWLPYATDYLEIVRHSSDSSLLLQKPYLAVGMVTLCAQERVARPFWKAVVAHDQRLEGFWQDVLRGNTKEEIGPNPRNPQALVRATAGTYNLFVSGSDSHSWEDILDYIEANREDKQDEWHEAPLLLLGTPYDGTRHRIYEPDADGSAYLNAKSVWNLPLSPEAAE